jgi:hypothetical protein
MDDIILITRVIRLGLDSIPRRNITIKALMKTLLKVRWRLRRAN